MSDSKRFDPPRALRITNRGRDQLITIKRRTGIENWNTICRWALTLSLREATDPPQIDQSGDSNVEMSWEVFGGPRREYYRAIVAHRMVKKDIQQTLSEYLRSHVHRGIQMMSGQGVFSDIREMVRQG